MLSVEQNEFICRTGPGTPMGEFFRRFWQPVLLSEELPVPDGSPVRARVLGEDLVAFRDTEGRIGLVDAYCAHRRAGLFFGRNEECGLRCVYHGWKYDVEGNCVDMPSEPPESNFREKIKLTAYPCVERAGLIWAYMGPEELRETTQLPDFEWMHVPDSHRYVTKTLTPCNYLQGMEGSLDPVHAAFLHRFLNREAQRSRRVPGLAGTGQMQEVRDRYGDVYRKFAAKDTDYGVVIGAGRDIEDQDMTLWNITHFLVPHYTLPMGGEPGLTQLCVLRTPIDDENHWFIWLWWNSDRALTERERSYLRSAERFQEMIPGTYLPKRTLENDFLIDRELQRTWNFTGVRSVPEQDRVVVESMGRIADRTKEHLGTSDTGIIAVRRRLMKMARDLQEGIEPYAASHSEVYLVRQLDVVLKRGVAFYEGAKALLTAKV